MPALAPLQKRNATRHDGEVAQAHSMAPQGAMTQLARALNARPQVAQLRALSTGFSRGAPVQRAASQLKPLRSALLNGAAPMQFAFWDYLKAGNISTSLLLGGVTGLLAASGIGIPAAVALGALTAGSTYAGGVGAGLGTAALGGAGILAAGVAPLAAAATVGGLAGGAVGAIGGKVAAGTGKVSPLAGRIGGTAIGVGLGALAPGAALGTLGALYGGTVGLDLQNKVSAAPNRDAGAPRPVAADAVYTRAKQNADRLNPNATAQQIVNQLGGGALQAAAQIDLNVNPPGTDQDTLRYGLQNFVRDHFNMQGRMVMPNAPAAVPAVGVEAAVRNALAANPFVQAATTVGVPAVAAANPLAFAHPPTTTGAQSALTKFNRLVDRPGGLPAITHARTMSPVSSMQHDGQLNESWVAPVNTTVHEMGHHLENSLTPLEFGSMHNFLAARSVATNRRPTGLGAHYNKPQSGRGYNTNTPNPLAPSTMPFTALGTNLIKSSIGLESGDRGIDHFVQSLSHTPESGYATQVYDDDTMATEFMSTTIHLMAEPGTAAALLQADPLRVALYLKMARPAAYQLVANQLAHPPPHGPAPINLNDEIHTL